MILAVDIANTYITVGCIDRKKTYFWERITTVIGKPNLEYAITLKSILEIYHINLSSIEGAIVSSVVPPLNRTISEAIRKITGIRAQFVGSGMKTGLNIRMDNPRGVGSDMIATAVGALEKHRPPLIIIDMSTAVSFSVIDAESNYIGGCLMPGIRIALDALSSNTAQLPKISLEAPRQVIGKNTVVSMQSGIVYGYASMFDGMIDRIEAELGDNAFIVATGGLMKLILPHLSHAVTFDETLILKGLLTLYERNRPLPGKMHRS
jgi:type III pantothenate kinase